MSNQPHIVLMDINLEGGHEGIETARWLRAVCEAPILFITGYTDPDPLDRIHEQFRALRAVQNDLPRQPCCCGGSSGYSPLTASAMAGSRVV